MFDHKDECCDNIAKQDKNYKLLHQLINKSYFQRFHRCHLHYTPNLYYYIILYSEMQVFFDKNNIGPRSDPTSAYVIYRF